MPYRYIPVVRTKAGEAQALGELSAAAKARVFPLVLMTRAVPATFVQNMIQHMAGTPIALSGNYNYSAVGSTAPFVSVFNQLGIGGVPVIPAISMSADPAYVAAAGTFIGAFGPGLVVTTSLADLPNAQAWVTARGWNPADVDLLVQIGDASQYEPTSYAGYVSHAINSAFIAMSPWRSVSLNAFSAPRDHSNLPPGRSLVRRADWQVWSLVHPGAAVQLDYSDWGHVHASLDEVPGFAMANATVSVRYAIDDYWVIRKGVQTGGPHGQPMTVQYRNHAIALTGEPQFGGLATACWGDGRIQHYATTTGGAGGRPQWAGILLNRHISLVTDRLP